MANLIVVHDAGTGEPILLNRDAIASATELDFSGGHSTTVELTNGKRLTISESIDDIRSLP